MIYVIHCHSGSASEYSLSAVEHSLFAGAQIACCSWISGFGALGLEAAQLHARMLSSIDRWPLV